MYRVLIFVACFAVGFGANSTNSGIVIMPTSTMAIVLSTAHTIMPIATTSVMSTQVSFMTSAISTSASMPTPTPTSTPTPKPSVTTTTKPPTTTAKPKPTHGDFSVKEGDKYCLLAQLDALLNVTYYQNKKDHKTNKTVLVKVFATINLPKEDFLTNGSECNEDNASLVISWPKNKPLYHFQMNFTRTKNNKSVVTGWEVTAVSFNASTADNKTFINATDSSLEFKVNETELKYLSGHVNGSYACAIDKDYLFGDNSSMMIIQYVKLRPFDVQDDGKGEVFGEEKNCEPNKPSNSDKNSNIVPIAVGCALAGLVLIVLIAYIIGRRKSQRGYEKV